MSAFAVGHLTRVNMGPAIVEYLKGIDATLAPFGGKFRVHGDPIELLEGEFCGDLIVIEFPNMETARQWYASPAYQAIMPLRTGHASGAIFLVAGVPGDHVATDILPG
jgi:uncharacterized protein (DUF1330 family)